MLTAITLRLQIQGSRERETPVHQLVSNAKDLCDRDGGAIEKREESLGTARLS